MENICEKCGITNPEDNIFCEKCGSLLIANSQAEQKNNSKNRLKNLKKPLIIMGLLIPVIALYYAIDHQRQNNYYSNTQKSNASYATPTPEDYSIDNKNNVEVDSLIEKSKIQNEDDSSLQDSQKADDKIRCNACIEAMMQMPLSPSLSEADKSDIHKNLAREECLTKSYCLSR